MPAQCLWKVLTLSDLFSTRTYNKSKLCGGETNDITGNKPKEPQQLYHTILPLSILPFLSGFGVTKNDVVTRRVLGTEAFLCIYSCCKKDMRHTTIMQYGLHVPCPYVSACARLCACCVLSCVHVHVVRVRCFRDEVCLVLWIHTINFWDVGVCVVREVFLKERTADQRQIRENWVVAIGNVKDTNSWLEHSMRKFYRKILQFMWPYYNTTHSDSPFGDIS